VVDSEKKLPQSSFVHLFHIQIQSSRDFKKGTPQYLVFCHFQSELYIGHEQI